MNLSAVLLFICFSTAYGVQCKFGGDSFNPKKKEKTERPIEYVECTMIPLPGDGSHLCVREEFIYSGPASGQGTGYSCVDAKFESMVNKACKGQKEGECYDESGREGEYQRKRKICCSKDPEFTGMPSLFSKESSPTDKPDNDSPSERYTNFPSKKASKSSSTFSSRALLAIITVLLGSIY